MGLYFEDIPNKDEETRIFRELDKKCIGYSSPWKDGNNNMYLLFTKDRQWKEIFKDYLDYLDKLFDCTGK